MTSLVCPYCGQDGGVIVHRSEWHKVDRSFGPFDIFKCPSCGSAGTANPPSPERLNAFYERYDEHRPQWYEAAARDSSLEAQYHFYARRISRFLPRSDASWIDIGAGHGEVASLLYERCPSSQGVAIDIGERPARLPPAVEHISCDLNRRSWAKALDRQFDLVFSVAVWEHVLAPADFARECLSLVAPSGSLVLIAPDNGSLAARVLGRHWPYFEPGEHIFIPTRVGARDCLLRAADALGLRGDTAEIRVRPLLVGYSLRYLTNVLRLERLSSMIPPGAAAPLPTGILLARVRRV
jgi:SAM-dependent methyltransferase